MKKSFLLFFCFSLCHCSLFVTKRDFPQIRGEKLPDEVTSEIVSDLNSRYAQIQNYRSLSRVTLASSGEAHRLRYVFVMDPQRDRMRVEVLAPSSALTLQLLFVHGKDATLLLLQDKVAYQGEFTAAEMEQFFGIRGDMKDLLSYLTASIPENDEKSFNGYTSPEAGGIVHLYSDDNEMYLVVDGRSHKLLKMMVKERGEDSVVLESEYSIRDVTVGDMTFPANLKLHLPEEDIEASVIFQMIKVNDELSEKLFEINIPSDYTVRDIP